MELLINSPIQFAVAAVCIAVVGFLFTQPNGLVNWVQKKNYQYEVTSSLYMLTPTEKFVFSTIASYNLLVWTRADQEQTRSSSWPSPCFQQLAYSISRTIS